MGQKLNLMKRNQYKTLDQETPHLSYGCHLGQHLGSGGRGRNDQEGCQASGGPRLFDHLARPVVLSHWSYQLATSNAGGFTRVGAP